MIAARLPGTVRYPTLITILGDGPEAYENINRIDRRHLDAMRRNWSAGATAEEIRSRILELRITYDWPALKSVVRVCPAAPTDSFRLNDLFNLLDMHIPSGFGFRGPAGSANQFFDARRLIGAKNA